MRDESFTLPFSPAIVVTAEAYKRDCICEQLGRRGAGVTVLALSCILRQAQHGGKKMEYKWQWKGDVTRRIDHER